MTAASALAAAVAALTLAACGPRDPSDSMALASSVAATQTSATTTQNDSGSTVAAVPKQGTPVPAAPEATEPPAPSVAAPPYAPAPVTTALPAPVRDAPPANYALAAERRAVSESRPIDRSRIGSVQSIEPIRERPQGTGTGAVIGGVLGAVVGNQFGHGLGRAAMTGLGAAGGAVAGNNVERNRREGVAGYRISIRLDNGTTRTFERGDMAGLQVGDRVRLDARSFHRV